MKPLHYKVIYRNGDRIPVEIADLYRTKEGGFVFEYVKSPKYEFPGFYISKNKFTNDTLWEQISFRVPNNIRNTNPGIPPEELLSLTNGKLVTDHFEFQLMQE